MKKRVVTAAPVHLSPAEAADIIGRCRTGLFPMRVRLADRFSLSTRAHLHVKLNRLATQTWGVEWQPGTNSWIPSFEGRLIVMRSEGSGTQLVLRGLYEVPPSTLGCLEEALDVDSIARYAVAHLLHEVARAIDTEADLERATRARSQSVRSPGLLARA